MPMAGQQGAFFLGGMDADMRAFVSSLLRAARGAGYTRAAEPCAGELVVSSMAHSAGFREIEASDVSILSGVLGRVAMGRGIEDMGISYRGTGEPESDPVRVLMEMKGAELLQDAGCLYGEATYRDFVARRDEIAGRIRSSLGVLRGSLGEGFRYMDMDQEGHLESLRSDGGTIVVTKLPTYRGGYEKQFRAIDGLLSWDAPEYGEFDPKTGYGHLLETMDGADCLYLMREDVPVGECVGTPVWGKASGRDGYMEYLVCNRPEAVDELMGRTCTVTGQTVRPSRYPLMPPDHELTKRSRVAVTKLPPECIRWYRRLWTHNFAPSEASTGYGAIIDGYLAGIYGYLRMFGMRSAFIGFLMTTGSPYRLTRLVYKIAMTRDSLAQEYTDLDLHDMREVETTMITPHQSLSEMRGIMGKVSKEQDKDGMGRRLRYSGPIEDATYQQQLRWFVQNEREYRERRK